MSDPERAHQALARIRALYADEREAKEKTLTGAAVAAYRQEHAGPVLIAFADWLAGQRPRVLPKSTIGEALPYVTNQWSTLGVYLTDGPQAIDNADAEQAIRPLCVGRRDWLYVGGDGGLTPTAVVMSLAASAKRHGIDPWAYLTHVLTELPARPAGADLADGLPDRWAKCPTSPAGVPGGSYPEELFARRRSPLTAGRQTHRAARTSPAAFRVRAVSRRSGSNRCRGS